MIAKLATWLISKRPFHSWHQFCITTILMIDKVTIQISEKKKLQNLYNLQNKNSTFYNWRLTSCVNRIILSFSPLQFWRVLLIPTEHSIFNTNHACCKQGSCRRRLEKNIIVIFLLYLTALKNNPTPITSQRSNQLIIILKGDIWPHFGLWSQCLSIRR